MDQVVVSAATKSRELVSVAAAGWILLTQEITENLVLRVTPVAIATRFIHIYEAAHHDEQVGWYFRAATPHLHHSRHSLVVHSSDFKAWGLRRVLEEHLAFEIVHQMPDWHYLTCGNHCSVITLPPTPSTKERFK